MNGTCIPNYKDGSYECKNKVKSSALCQCGSNEIKINGSCQIGTYEVCKYLPMYLQSMIIKMSHLRCVTYFFCFYCMQRDIKWLCLNAAVLWQYIYCQFSIQH